jgi:hypothetical protein
MWLAGIMIAAYSGAAREAAQFPARMGEDGGVTVIDVWMQHPTRRLLQQEMFTSLRRWTGQLPDQEISLDRTLTAMGRGWRGARADQRLVRSRRPADQQR